MVDKIKDSIPYSEYLVLGAFSRIEKEDNIIVSLALREKVIKTFEILESLFKYYPIFYSVKISAEHVDKHNAIYFLWQSIEKGTAIDIGIYDDGWFDIATDHTQSIPMICREIRDIITFFFSFIRDTYRYDNES